MLKFSYVPIRLKQTANEIRHSHRSVSEPVKDLPGEDAEKFVREVCALSTEKVQNYARLLSDRKVLILAVYLTQNNFHVELDNIIMILRLRMSADVFRTIYRSWQNSYNVYTIPECTDFITLTIKRCAEKSYYIKTHGLKSSFERWSKADNIDLEVCKTLIKYCERNKCDYSEAENYFDIKGSVLAEQASKWYYCCCDGAVLISTGDIELYDKVKNYDSSFRRKFLLNFLNCLDVKQMAEYKNVWKIAYDNIGAPEGKGYNLFFPEKTDNIELIKKRYRQWYIINQMYSIFGVDERSRYWEGKVYDYDVTECNYKKSVETFIMKFNGKYVSYYIIEFKTIGPLYIFSEKYYNENIKRLFTEYLYANSSNELRSVLYHNHTQREGFDNRFTHHGYWQGSINTVLKKVLGR